MNSSSILSNESRIFAVEGKYPHYLYLYKDILDQVRSDLMIEPHVEDLVVETLGDVRKGRAEHSEGKDIIFVGVHARRTDYAFHLQVLLPS